MKITIPAFAAGVLAATLSTAAFGRDTEAQGRETRAWLQKQKSPAAQAPAARGLPGEAADRVYQRYLQSFTRPIPERFERERTSSDTQR